VNPRQLSSLPQRAISRIGHQWLGLRDFDRERVFVTGLSRTGTSSITCALERLGYRTIHWPPLVGLGAGETIELDWPWWMEQYDAFTDIPVTAFYQQLDERYPNSRFIETTRPKHEWLQSCREHFSVPSVQEEARRLHLLIYGSDLFDEERFSAAHDRHAAEVRAYFAGRADYLEIAITKGEGWEKLCPFLGKPIPEEPFPRENGATYFQLTPSGFELLQERIRRLASDENAGNELDDLQIGEHLNLSPAIAGELLRPGAVLHLRKWGYAFDALELQLDIDRDLHPILSSRHNLQTVLP